MKIAFFDIDGTLIDVEHGMHEPSLETVEALTQFRRQGNKIVIASARGTIPEGVNVIDFDGYICSDGHYIILDDKVIVDDIFTENQIQKQLEVYKKCNGKAMFNGHDKEWCNCFGDELILKHHMMFNGTDQKPDHLCEEYQPSDIQAISCCVLFDNVDNLKRAYYDLKDDFTIVPYETGLIRMDVYCQGFKKGTACQHIYKKLNIDYEDTYAFGDGVNDIEMFQLVKHGIAMSNAVDQLKEVASEVTDSVSNNGVANYLNKYLIRS